MGNATGVTVHDGHDAQGRCRFGRLDAVATARTLLLVALVGLLSCLPAIAADWRYRVRPGDTLWDLTRMHARQDVAWQRVQAYNKIADPHRILPGTVLRFPVGWLKIQPAQATVVGVVGDATATDDSGRRPVVAGMRLGAGTTVDTAADASLTLRFADGSELLVQASSQLRLDKLSAYGRTGMVDTRMRLQKGRVDSRVKSLRGPGAKFIIQTPDIMSSVRGTRFRVGSEDGASQVEVTEGRVMVAHGDQGTVLRPRQGVAARTADDRAIAPTPLLPAPGALDVDATQRPIRVQWKPVPGAAGYRVLVGANATFPYLLHDRVVAGTEDLLDSLPDGDHAVRVRAIDARGVEGQDAVVESTIAMPAPFALETPDGPVVEVDRPRFRWASMGPGTRYHLQVAGTAGYASPLVDLPGITGNEVRSPVALPPGEYRWRIATIDRHDRVSAYNEGGRLTVAPPTAGPGVTREAPRERDALRIRWQEGLPGQHYRFQLSRRPDFGTLEVDRVVEQPHAIVPSLRAGQWYARVQAIDGDGYARPFGPPQAIKVGCLPCRWVGGGAALLLVLSL